MQKHLFSVWLLSTDLFTLKAIKILYSSGNDAVKEAHQNLKYNTTLQDMNIL